MSIAEIVEFLIQTIAINICVCLLFLKISNNKEYNVIVLAISILVISLLYTILKYLEFNFIVILGIVALIYSTLLAVITKKLISYSIIVIIISYSIAFIAEFVAGIIVYLLVGTTYNEATQTIHVIVTHVLTIFIVCIFLKIKRISNGFSFMNNVNSNKLEILNVTFFIISIEIILYFIILRKSPEELTGADVFSFLIITSIFMAMLLFMCFRSYYKSIQTQKLIENLNSEIKVKDEKYNKLYTSHERVTKKLHEISPKVKALAYSVDGEFAEENEELLNEIEEVNEKLNKNSAIDKEYNLPKANVLGIDIMLNYMRSEVLKNNIEFELVVSGDIKYMIDNVVNKQNLETMIADHIKDGIIAIKSNDNRKNKKISVRLGKFSNNYEFSISDTGIEFEINTLLKLGLERVTTHLETGGTGIGFESTFETLQKYNASLEIAEFIPEEDKPYTKTVRIFFDNKNEYRIYSYRKEEIASADKNHRIILEKNRRQLP